MFALILVLIFSGFAGYGIYIEAGNLLTAGGVGMIAVMIRHLVPGGKLLDILTLFIPFAALGYGLSFLYTLFFMGG